MDEGTGTTTVDSSGYGYNGTVYGNTWKTSSDCKRGGCIDFLGSTGDYIDMGDVLDIGTNSFSMVIWIKPEDISGGNERYICKYGTGYTRQSIWKYSGSSAIYFDYCPEASCTGQQLICNSSIVNGNWYHIAAIAERGGYAKIYINGDLCSTSGSTVNTEDIQSAESLIIGNFSAGGSHHYDGLMDDVRIYHRTLSASEVKAIYEGTK